MPEQTAAITRQQFAGLLSEDLSREQQEIIADTVYSEVLHGAQNMSIDRQPQIHAAEELKLALTIARQIDCLGAMPDAMPNTTPRPVKLSDVAEDLLRADVQNGADTIRRSRTRIRQCEALASSPLLSTSAKFRSTNRTI